MGRTWLLRGCAVAVFAVLGSAWATGVVALGGTPSTATKHTAPEDAAQPPAAVHVQRGGILERATPRHKGPSADPSEVVSTEPTTTAVDDPSAAPSTSSPSAPSTPQDPSTPSGPSGGETGIPQPTHDPSTTPPSDPSDGCTALSQVLGCVLAPITHHP